MPNLDEIYISGGSYLKGTYLKELKKDLRLTISGVEVKKIKAEDKRAKAILSFDEIPETLPLNAGNYAMVKEVCGTPDSDEWIGQQVTLYATKDTYGGKIFDVVRVRPPTSSISSGDEVPF